MDIQIDAKQVEAAVAAAIVQSSIGEQVKKAVNDTLNYSSRGVVQSAVDQVVRGTAIEYIKTVFKTQIEAAVREKLTEKFVAECAGAFIDAALARLRKWND